MARDEGIFAGLEAGFIEELKAFVALPSVSSEPGRRADVRRAAAWLADRLERSGARNARLLETDGHPAVYGEMTGPPDRPVALVYGHYDVQPAGPAAAWASPPFQAELRDGSLYGRGTTDDKGNLLLPLYAAESLASERGGLPLTLKFLFEGEEEVGSPHLGALLEKLRKELSCELVLSADGAMWSEDRGSLVVGTRGACLLRARLKGADADLHSGMFGGAVPNPVHALAAMLASLHDGEGRVAVPGFYGKVRPPSREERAAIASLGFDEEGFLRRHGLRGFAGEAGWSTLERLWLRPTLEVNGISGGAGPGELRAVVPSSAEALISCRLVPDQDPEEIAAMVEERLRELAPPGLESVVEVERAQARPYEVPARSPGMEAAAEALRDVYGVEPARTRIGGSLPSCSLFEAILGAPTVIFGFSLEDEGEHAPNERWRLSSMAKGFEAYRRLFSLLGESRLRA